MWYGQCGINPATQKPANCLYNKRAKAVDGPKSLEILQQLCPELAYNNSTVCCDYKQLLSLQSGLQTGEQMMQRCPACWKNFRELYCRMTCSPNNSMFIDPTNIADDNITLLSIDYYVDKAYRDGMYNSCKDVIFPSNNQKIMSIMCGCPADQCTALKFLKFMGDPAINNVSPFMINFPAVAKKGSGITPMYVGVIPCNETVFKPSTNKTSAACSCQDCIKSCQPFPHYNPTHHWELDMGDIHFNIVSFATLIVYLVFLVLFIACNIVYYIYASRHYSSKPEYTKAIIGGRRYGLLEKLGMYMDRTIKRLFNAWGNVCCDYPLLVILLAFIFVVICSLGLLKFTVITDPVKLWSAPNSQAREEKNLFDSKFSPFYRTAQIIFTVKSGSQWNRESCYKSFQVTPYGKCGLTGRVLRLEALQRVSRH